MKLHAAIFDVDGTLVDSQGDIMISMNRAFASVDRPCPPRNDILMRVGLSLDVIFAQLAQDLPGETRDAMVQCYKDSYASQRRTRGSAVSSPLFEGIAETLAQLHAQDDILLGVATGKSRRGLTHLLQGHGLEHIFLTKQVADDHPSKPHPAMLQKAMDDLGVDHANTVMIGDTSFDLEMARAAGSLFLGVSWGYHAPDRLQGADLIISDPREIPNALNDLWGRTDV